MIPTPTRAAAISGIGWSNGMAAQLNLPNMFTPPAAGTRSDATGPFAGGAALAPVDEASLPMQRDELALERRCIRCQRLGGIKLMGSDPGEASEEDDRQEGDGPDDELDTAGLLKIRQVDRSGVGGAKAP